MSFGEVGFQPIDVGGLETQTRESPSLGEVTFGALAVGAGRDPFVRLAFDALDDIIPQLSPAALGKLEAKLQGSDTASVFEFMGEFGPLIAPGLGAFSAGRLGARALVAGSRAAVLREGREFLLSQAGTRAAAAFRNTPLGLRAAEAVGGSVGFGLEGFARGSAEGLELDEALMKGAEQFALSLGIEGGLIGLGRIPGLRRLVGERGESQSLNALSERQALDNVLEESQRLLVARAAQLGGGRVSLETLTMAQRGLGPDEVARFNAASQQSLALRQGDVFARGLRDVEALEADFAREATRAGQTAMLTSSREAEQYYLLHTLEGADELIRAGSLPRGVETFLKQIVRRAGQAEDNVATADFLARAIPRQREAAIEASTAARTAAAESRQLESQLFALRELEPVFREPATFAGYLTRGMDDVARFDRQNSRSARLLDRALEPLSMNARQVGELTDHVAGVMKSPETMGREMGISMALATDMAKRASINTRVAEQIYRTNNIRRWEQLAQAMNAQREFRGGVRAIFRGRSGRFAEPVRDVFEAGEARQVGSGLRAVEREFGPQVAEAWSAIMNDFRQVTRQAEQLGGLSPMRPLELQQIGVAEYFPHRVTLPEGAARERLRDRLIEHYTTRERNQLSLSAARQQADSAISAMERNNGAGLRKVGAVDQNRFLPGTTREKLEMFEGLEGVVEADPFRVMDDLYGQLAHRLEFGRMFGTDGRILDGMAQVARQEGIPAGRVQMLVDLYGGRSWNSQATRQIAKLAVNGQIMSKLGLATIPNITQPINNAAAFGAKNFANGTYRFFRNPETRELALQAHGVVDASTGSVGRMILEELQTVQGMGSAGPLDAAARALLTVNGFSFVEGFNRAISSGVGITTFRDVAAKHAQGRLVGHAARIAREQFASLGLNLDEVARAGFYRQNPQRLAEALNTAAYHAARTTQFVQDITRAPAYWQTPLGRVVFQFKTFAFQQGKFIRDNVLREAERGNLAPLAQLLTIYPAAGSVINDALDQLKENPKRKSGLEKYVSDLAAVGGFGIMYSMVNSLSYRSGAEAFIGPTASDLIGVLEDVVQDDPGGALWKRLERLPSFRLGKSVAGGAGAIIGGAGAAASDLVGPSTEDDLLSRILKKPRN